MRKHLIDNWVYLIGAVVILILFSLRFYNLTILPIFADEAIYVRWAQIMKAEETLRFLPLSDGKQPLFMLVVIPFLKVIEDPLMAGRLVSVATGFGNLLGVVFMTWLLSKNKIATLVSGILYSLIPFFFFFDRMALVDSMLSMFGIWTFIFSYLAITKGRLDFAMLAGFSLGGAWLTKSPALIFALMLPTLMIFANWKKSLNNNMLIFLRSSFLLLVTIIIGYAFYNILRLGSNYSMIASRNLDYVYPLSHLLSNPFDPLKPFLLESAQYIWKFGTATFVILWLSCYLLNLKKYWKPILILTIWGLVPILINSEFAKVLTARYILYTIPYLIVIASLSFVVELKSNIKILFLILAVFVVQAGLFDYFLLTNPEKANLPKGERAGYLEEWTAGQGIKETADYLINERNNNPNQKIVVGTEGYFGTLPDGLMAYLNNEKSIIVLGTGLNYSDIPKPLIESRKSGNKTYLLINNERFKGDHNNPALKLVAEYPKALRPNGTYQSLLFYELR